MQKSSLLHNVVFRNIAGFAALAGVHVLAYQANMVQWTGINKTWSYFFLFILYGWIVFHNRVLFEMLYLRKNKWAYFGWTLLAMVLCSLTTHYILTTGFNVGNTLPYIVSFWVYTFIGLMVFVVWRNLGQVKSPRATERAPAGEEPTKEGPAPVFSCVIDGFPKEIRYEDIHYIESMDDSIRIVTRKKALIAPLSLKETELRLPAPPFIRISRARIVNSNHIQSKVGEMLMIHGMELKIEKVFKRYVEKFLK